MMMMTIMMMKMMMCSVVLLKATCGVVAQCDGPYMTCSYHINSLAKKRQNADIYCTGRFIPNKLHQHSFHF